MMSVLCESPEIGFGELPAWSCQHSGHGYIIRWCYQGFEDCADLIDFRSFQQWCRSSPDTWDTREGQGLMHAINVGMTTTEDSDVAPLLHGLVGPLRRP